MESSTVYEAKTQFSRLLARVEAGEEIVICRGKTAIAKLVPLSKPERQRTLGSAKGKIKIAADFDLPLDEFANYR
jgi:antitoxin (DNA-binding transcriptional repressor) of toxin-antitoxin stability system